MYDVDVNAGHQQIADLAPTHRYRHDLPARPGCFSPISATVDDSGTSTTDESVSEDGPIHVGRRDLPWGYRSVMIQLAFERTIPASPAEVFDRLADLDGYQDWLRDDSNSSGCTRTSDGRIGRGSTYGVRTKMATMFGEDHRTRSTRAARVPAASHQVRHPCLRSDPDERTLTMR